MLFRSLHGFKPILFLDDVLSELDEKKRAKLVEILIRGEGQTFITTTDLNVPKTLLEAGAKIFYLKNGEVEPA